MSPLPEGADPLTHQLVLILGKGGVGKSTVAAALARLRASRGERVLLCEINGGDRLASLLGVAPSGPDLKQVDENLWLCNLTGAAALHEYAVMKLKFDRVVDRLLENRVVHYFLRLIPSVPEITTLGKLLFHVKERQGNRPRFDAVILDAPATGHGLSLLRVPKTLLASVPDGALREDMTWMQALLVDPQITTAVLVTLCEELPVNETLELSQALQNELQIAQGACIANEVWPDRFDVAALAEIQTQAPPAAWAVAERFAAEAAESKGQLGRLHDTLKVPIAELPMVFDARDGMQLTRTIEAQLGAALRAGRQR